MQIPVQVLCQTLLTRRRDNKQTIAPLEDICNNIYGVRIDSDTPVLTVLCSAKHVPHLLSPSFYKPTGSEF